MEEKGIFGNLFNKKEQTKERVLRARERLFSGPLEERPPEAIEVEATPVHFNFKKDKTLNAQKKEG